MTDSCPFDPGAAALLALLFSALVHFVRLFDTRGLARRGLLAEPDGKTASLSKLTQLSLSDFCLYAAFYLLFSGGLTLDLLFGLGSLALASAAPRVFSKLVSLKWGGPPPATPPTADPGAAPEAGDGK